MAALDGITLSRRTLGWLARRAGFDGPWEDDRGAVVVSRRTLAGLLGAVHPRGWTVLGQEAPAPAPTAKQSLEDLKTALKAIEAAYDEWIRVLNPAEDALRAARLAHNDAVRRRAPQADVDAAFAAYRDANDAYAALRALSRPMADQLNAIALSIRAIEGPEPLGPIYPPSWRRPGTKGIEAYLTFAPIAEPMGVVGPVFKEAVAAAKGAVRGRAGTEARLLSAMRATRPFLSLSENDQFVAALEAARATASPLEQAFIRADLEALKATGNKQASRLLQIWAQTAGTARVPLIEAGPGLERLFAQQRQAAIGAMQAARRAAGAPGTLAEKLDAAMRATTAYGALGEEAQVKLAVQAVAEAQPEVGHRLIQIVNDMYRPGAVGQPAAGTHRQLLDAWLRAQGRPKVAPLPTMPAPPAVPEIRPRVVAPPPKPTSAAPVRLPFPFGQFGSPVFGIQVSAT